jgi:hypothetical protein
MEMTKFITSQMSQSEENSKQKYDTRSIVISCLVCRWVQAKNHKW